jgi:hypothetical protein
MHVGLNAPWALLMKSEFMLIPRSVWTCDLFMETAEQQDLPTSFVINSTGQVNKRRQETNDCVVCCVLRYVRAVFCRNPRHIIAWRIVNSAVQPCSTEWCSLVLRHIEFRTVLFHFHLSPLQNDLLMIFNLNLACFCILLRVWDQVMGVFYIRLRQVTIVG